MKRPLWIIAVVAVLVVCWTSWFACNRQEPAPRPVASKAAALTFPVDENTLITMRNNNDQDGIEAHAWMLFQYLVGPSNPASPDPIWRDWCATSNINLLGGPLFLDGHAPQNLYLVCPQQESEAKRSLSPSDLERRRTQLLERMIPGLGNSTPIDPRDGKALSIGCLSSQGRSTDR